MALTRIQSSGIEGNITLGNVVISGTITDGTGAVFVAGTGAVGFTGSRGTDGIIGVDGYTGSAGPAGYTGSMALLDWTVITANYTAGNRERLMLNSSAGGFTVTLPAVPVSGYYIQMTDGANLSTNPVTIFRNGSTIESVAQNIVIDVPNATYEFIFDGTTWQLTSTAGPRGLPGEAGYTGSTGSVGPAGYTGSQGAGFTGSAGAAGEIGYTGSTGGFDPTQALIVSNTTPSTSTSSGALQVVGGAGIDGNVYVGKELYVTGNILPTSNNTVNIGSPSQRFGTLYLSANSIDIGGTVISATEQGDLNFTTPAGNVSLTANTISFLESVDTGGIPTIAPGVANLYQSGPLRLITGTARWYAPYNLNIESVQPRVVSSADNGIILNVKKNGALAVSITIPSGEYETAASTSGISMLDGDYLTVDVAQIGSSAQPGAELYMQFKYKITQ
jgi:hypothetical protein